MIYSKTCEYAIRALSTIQSPKDKQGVSIGEVSRRSKVPQAYVAKIFQALAKSGILVSRRGPGGGFTLKIKPKELTVLRVMQALDDPAQSPFVRCVMGLQECNDRNPCPLHPIWSVAKEKMITCVSTCTVSELSGLTDKFPSGALRRKRLSRKMRHLFKQPGGVLPNG